VDNGDMAKPTTIAEYVNAAPEHSRPHLREIHRVLREVAPNATEAIKWGAPVLEQGRILFSYSAFKQHLVFFPTPATMQRFAAALADHDTTPSGLRVRYDQPLPVDPIRRLAQDRLHDVLDNDAHWM
jgi:uncharacterized protein YdhG (YjbR/CyaY superfamily)